MTRATQKIIKSRFGNARHEVAGEQLADQHNARERLGMRALEDGLASRDLVRKTKFKKEKKARPWQPNQLLLAHTRTFSSLVSSWVKLMAAGAVVAAGAGELEVSIGVELAQPIRRFVKKRDRRLAAAIIFCLSDRGTPLN
jgi:hypothetical protein